MGAHLEGVPCDARHAIRSRYDGACRIQRSRFANGGTRLASGTAHSTRCGSGAGPEPKADPPIESAPTSPVETVEPDDGARITTSLTGASATVITRAPSGTVVPPVLRRYVGAALLAGCALLLSLFTFEYQYVGELSRSSS